MKLGAQFFLQQFHSVTTAKKVVASALVCISFMVMPTSVASASGRLLAAPINTVLNGTGAPASTLGANGDFYIDKKSFNIYGPKTNGRWPLPVSLKGPVGTMGPIGLSGKVVTASGGVVTGERGATGPKGETGTAGPAGLNGTNGSNGATGLTGATGPAGANGSSGGGSAGPAGPAGSNGAAGATGATGPAGVVGATGAVGAVGAQGPQGLVGATGATGATGASGSSSVSSGSLTFLNQIVLPRTSQDSNGFGTFEAGKSYVVDVFVTGVAADGSSLTLNVAFAAGAGMRIVSSSYVIGSGYSFRGGSAKYESSAIAKLLVTVDSGSSQQITVTASSSNASSGDPMTLAGYFTNEQVGSVS